MHSTARKITLVIAAIYVVVGHTPLLYAQPFFENVTEETGAARKQLFSSRGISSGDFNNDGRPDLFFADNWQNKTLLLENTGEGGFTNANARIRSDISSGRMGGGPVWGDYDNDGDLDLYVTTGQYLAGQWRQNILLRNDRGVFVDVADEAGLIDIQSTDNAIWLDYDRDGFIDLYTGNVGDPSFRNLLYRNRGDGTFEDVTDSAGLHIPFHPEGGGSNGGMVAGDFNNDGWPDLYVAVFRAENRLFLNNQQGGFIESNNSDIRDNGEAFGAATGDIDNDGDLDLLFAAGGSQTANFRSGILLNLGNAEFLDITDGIGVETLSSSIESLGINLADIDNDGDLDIMAGWDPALLFINTGDGTFVDASVGSGLLSQSLFTLLFADFNLDGFLDILGGGGGSAPPIFYHNIGNKNHWLRVELAGERSNRNGIGARIIATTDTLRQTREILGGLGFYQDEMVAHFGVGQRTIIDELEIRWPSGQIDFLSNIPTDQHIRILEGRPQYHPVAASQLRITENRTSLVGRETSISLEVIPAKFDHDAQITSVVADLSAVDGPHAIELPATNTGTFGKDIVFTPTVSGFGEVSVLIDQQTSLGPRWTQLSKSIGVLPTTNQPIFAGQLAAGWSLIVRDETKMADFEGRSSVWPTDVVSLTYRPETPVPALGYRGLRFAFHPGSAVERFTNRLSVSLGNLSVPIFPDTKNITGISLENKQWQEIEIPLTQWHITEQEVINEVRISGRMKGSIRLADIQLVTHDAPRPTAIVEQHDSTHPLSFALDQNYPNPFNSGTVIRFALPTASNITLSVYNLAGQQVATLAQGQRRAGNYRINWDGRDDTGGTLASGIYFYRLYLGDGRVETRKLMLLR